MVSPAPSTPPTPLKCERVERIFRRAVAVGCRIGIDVPTFGVATLIVTVPVPMPATPGSGPAWYVNESEPVNPTAGLW